MNMIALILAATLSAGNAEFDSTARDGARDISVTHVALGTTRLMRTHGMMGEVVGMAASICKKHGCNPRDVYKSHLDELKGLMTKGVGLDRPQEP